uniref:Uncharacterized protein n=1 Tax=Lepeophtheirus salmonis TaxID=72036 RepID=A0A0K2U737_LEPSM
MKYEPLRSTDTWGRDTFGHKMLVSYIYSTYIST